jgi:hypothetical protein
MLKAGVYNKNENFIFNKLFRDCMMLKNISFIILVLGVLLILPSVEGVPNATITSRTSASVHSGTSVECTAYVDDTGCSRLKCTDSRLEDKACPPSYLNNPVPFIYPARDKPCIKYGYSDEYGNDFSKEVCLGDNVIIKDNRMYCTAYMTTSGCAESFCTMGVSHDTLCPSGDSNGMSGVGTDDVPTQTNDTSCKIQYNPDTKCLNLLCGGYTKNVCIDKVATQYSAQITKVNTTIMFPSVESMKITLENISQTYKALNIRAIAVANYYRLNGDTQTANKYDDLAVKFTEIASMVDNLENKIIAKSNTVSNLNNLTQEEKEDILSDVKAIVQKIDIVMSTK